jgi:hypothetical protein
MMEIPGLSSASQALSLVGSITELVKKGATIELQTTIVSLKEAVLALKEENIDLKEKVNELKRMSSQKQSVKFERPNYYIISTDGEKDGPYCQVCYDDQKSTLVRLQDFNEGMWKCGSCKNTFRTEENQRRFNTIGTPVFVV